MKKSVNLKNTFIISSIIILILLIGVSYNLKNDEMKYEASDFVTSLDDEIKVTSRGLKYIVDPDKILSGGPPKGGIGVERGIPALAEDNINFVSINKADAWIEDNELILMLDYKGEKRVYPLQILVWHEIVNDRFNGEAILVTYCPLCGSGIAYESYIEVNGKRIESRFGTSGKLFNSNLVMYDEETDSYWTQIDGKAIVGSLTGQELKEISIDTLVWRDWKASPLSEGSIVLSQDTGMNRPYGNDPYGSYYEDSFVFFPVENEDSRVHPKTVIFGIEINDSFLAFKEEDLIQNPIIETEFAGFNIKAERSQEGIVTITNLDTEQEIVKERDFWFAWYAFHPTTELYEN